MRMRERERDSLRVRYREGERVGKISLEDGRKEETGVVQKQSNEKIRSLKPEKII